MPIWNRALITLLNPGGLEPEPGEISEFKDRRKAKTNKAKPEPGRRLQEPAPEQAARGGLCCALHGLRGAADPERATAVPELGAAQRLPELPFPPPRDRGGRGSPGARPVGPDRQVESRARARRPATRAPGGAARRRGGRRKRRARPLGPARRVRAAPALSAGAPGRRGRGVRAARAERVAPAGPRPARPPRRSRLGPPAQGAVRRAGRALSGAMRR